MSTPSTDSLPSPLGLLPQEEDSHVADHESGYRALLARLSQASITKHFEAYVDVPWDDPEYAIDLNDPRWIIHEANPLGATDWYQSQPEAVQAQIGVHLTATFMKIGRQFEGVLKQGLLQYALTLPNNAPEFRYVYHEVIEEAQHSLMFQEFVNRTGLDIPGLPKAALFGARRIVTLGRRFPELFFLFVLGGEDPIDYVQREHILASKHERHPLLERVSQIHVTEEARHISFARAYLRRHVPSLGLVRRHLLRLRTPMILGGMAQFMMQPSPEIVKQYAIPRSVMRQAYGKNPAYLQEVQNAVGKLRKLCVELGIMSAPYDRIWYKLGIAPTSGSRVRAA